MDRGRKGVHFLSTFTNVMNMNVTIVFVFFIAFGLLVLLPSG